ncbi:MAG TPA: hypothetical protein QF520_02955 [SAR202 cluster bacterium]|nr:hypothetical protein [SAR202 cluster bacterium]
MEVRGLTDILGEAFTIYGRRFKQLIRLTAIVQVPATLIALAPNSSLASTIALTVINLFAMATVSGAMVFAVGQQYVADKVDVGRCYARVAGRAVSMFALTAILSVIVVLAIVLMDTKNPVAASLALIAITAGLVYAAYLALATPVVIVERFRWGAALQRGFALARGHEWRLIKNLLAYGLVGFGLTIILLMPFLLVAAGNNLDAITMLQRLVLATGNTVVAVLVPPVPLIATTLLYYDLRVRKESYDIATLSQELGTISRSEALA